MALLRNHPDAIFVQLTTGCNAKCTSCPHPFTYGPAGDHETGNMKSEVWNTLIDQIKAARYKGQVGLYLHHEPLLVNNLAARIADVNEKTEAFVVLSTNGALLTEARSAELIEARPKQIHINISSADPDQYEDIMKINWAVTRKNTHRFIKECKDLINIEINCPVLPGVDTQKLVDEFPDVKVNIEYWANSRGGLLDEVDAGGKGSRFNFKTMCNQPKQNFNVLWDGSVILCCMDWAHESKSDFPSVLEQDLFETYGSDQMTGVSAEFRKGDYSRYKMCDSCARELDFNVGRPITVADQVADVAKRIAGRIGYG